MTNRLQFRDVGQLVRLFVDWLYLLILMYMTWQVLLMVCAVFDADHFNKLVSHKLGQFCDFRGYYTFGLLSASSDSALLYDRAAQESWFCRFATPVGASCKDAAFVPYAPFFSFIMRPFVMMPLNVSYVLWVIVSCVLFAGAVFYCARARDGKWSLVLPLAITFGTLASLPTMRSVVLGQSGLLSAALVAAMYASWMVKRERLAGILMALTTFKFQFVIFMFLPVVAQRRWKLLLSFLVTEVVLWGAAAIGVGWKPTIEALPAAFAQTSVFTEYYTMLCLRSLWAGLPRTVDLALTLIVFIAGQVAIYLLWRRARPFSNDQRSCWLVAITILLALATSVYTQLYDAVLLAIPAVVTLKVAGSSNVLMGGNAYRLWWASIWLLPMLGWFGYLVFSVYSPWFYHLFTLALVVLLIVSHTIYKQMAHCTDADEKLCESTNG